MRPILLLALATFASAANLRICDALLPQVARELAVSVGDAAAIVTSFAIAYGFLQLVYGPVGDRLGKYRVIAWGSIAAGIASAGAAFAPDLRSLTVVRFIAGGFAGGVIPLAFAWIGDTVSEERRQAVLARFLSSTVLGMTFGQAAGGILGDLFGWRGVFSLLAVIQIAAGLIMLIELRINAAAQPPLANVAPGLGPLIASAKAILSRPWVQVVLVTVLLEGMLMNGAFAYVGADLHLRFGLGFGAIGLLLMGFGAGALLYTAIGPILLRLLGERGFALGGGAIMSTCYMLLAVSPVYWLSFPVLAVLGLGFFLLHNTLQAAATQMAPEARGLALAIFAASLFIGNSIGVALGAPLMDRYGGVPIFIVAAVGLPIVALWFRSKLHLRPR